MAARMAMVKASTKASGRGSGSSSGSSKSRRSKSPVSPDMADVGLRRRHNHSYDDVRYDDVQYHDDGSDEIEQLLVRYWDNRPVANSQWRPELQSENCHRCNKKVSYVYVGLFVVYSCLLNFFSM